MAMPSPGFLRSWLKQERQALANPGWRTLLKLAAPLLSGLVVLEGARRLHERSQHGDQHGGLQQRELGAQLRCNSLQAEAAASAAGQGGCTRQEPEWWCSANTLRCQT